MLVEESISQSKFTLKGVHEKLWKIFYQSINQLSIYLSNGWQKYNQPIDMVSSEVKTALKDVEVTPTESGKIYVIKDICRWLVGRAQAPRITTNSDLNGPTHVFNGNVST